MTRLVRGTASRAVKLTRTVADIQLLAPALSLDDAWRVVRAAPGQIGRLRSLAVVLSQLFLVLATAANAQPEVRAVIEPNSTTARAEQPSHSTPRGVLEVVYDGTTDSVSLHARGTTLQAVLTELGRKANVSIDFAKEADLEADVSATITKAPLEQALRTLLQEHNAIFVYSNTSEVKDRPAPRLVGLTLVSRKRIDRDETRGTRYERSDTRQPPLSGDNHRVDSTRLLQRIVQGRRADVEAIVNALRGVAWDEERTKIVDALIQRLAGPLPVPEGIISALRLLDPDRALDTLASLLEHSDRRVRANAAVSLGQLRDERAVEALTRALDATDAGIRRAAATSLALIGGPEATTALVDAYLAADRVRKHAIWLAITSHGDARSQLILTRLIQAGHEPSQPAGDKAGSGSQGSGGQ